MRRLLALYLHKFDYLWCPYVKSYPKIIGLYRRTSAMSIATRTGKILCYHLFLTSLPLNGRSRAHKLVGKFADFSQNSGTIYIAMQLKYVHIIEKRVSSCKIAENPSKIDL